MKQVPEHRYLSVKNCFDPLKDYKLERLRCYLLKLNKSDDPSVDTAYQIFTLEFCKACMESYLLSEASIMEIAVALQLDYEVVELYEYYFFDRSIFSSRMFKVAWIMGLDANSNDEITLREIRLTSLKLGFDYLNWQTTGTLPKIKKDEIKELLLAETYLFFRQEVNNGNSKGATSLLKEIINLMDDGNKYDPSEIRRVFEGFRLKIENIRQVKESKALPEEVRKLLDSGKGT